MTDKELIKGLEELKWFLKLFYFERENQKSGSMVKDSFEGTKTQFARYLKGDWKRIKYSKRCGICKKNVNYDPKKDKCESYKYENSGYSIQYDKKINITKFLKLIKKEDLKLKIKKLENGFGLFHSIICYNCLNELPKELSTKFIMFEDDYPSKQSGKVFQLVEKLIEEGILIKIPNHDKPIYRINAVKLNKYWNEDSFLKHIEMVVQQKDMLEKNIKEIKKNGLPHIPGCIGIECLAYEILIDLENEEEKNILKQGNIKKGT